MYNVENLGQVFTPQSIVAQMLTLRHNDGRVLEPSCGDGAFFNEIPNCVGIEIDSKHCPHGAMNMDFFDYPISEKFDTIIGNPPYVRYQDITKETKLKLKSSLFDE
ncbi:MAG: Eco57I restriction-modification methylase domain-containing protein, partial [Prevotella sp.]|nr:Eco57I restriction-modification methylase domain-containing protein [Prevotella sp.]